MTLIDWIVGFYSCGIIFAAGVKFLPVLSMHEKLFPGHRFRELKIGLVFAVDVLTWPLFIWGVLNPKAWFYPERPERYIETDFTTKPPYPGTIGWVIWQYGCGFADWGAYNPEESH